MKMIPWTSLVVLPTVLCAATPAAQANAGIEPFLGCWALTLPGDRAGWLSVTEGAGYYDAELLWGGGSPFMVQSAYVDGDTLHVTVHEKVERKDKEGKVLRTHVFTRVIEATVRGDAMELVHIRPHHNGRRVARETFTGVRIPALPIPPDLSKVEFGDPVTLFNGEDLEGWTLTDAHAKSGWSAADGVLANDPVQPEGGRRIHYGNLRTEAEFEDFNLTLEVNVPERGNSGVYLRGIYEVQVLDSYGHPCDRHNMGAIYGRIAPEVSAEKPHGTWQTLDITLCDRHVTVKLNGTTLIDNQPLLGCTGGALWPDEFRPGPIYFQGDHTGVKYRSLVLRPIVGR